MLSYYNPTAERLEYTHISSPKSVLILGMNATKQIFYISSSVVRLRYVRTILDGCIFENNQWVLGWIRYHRGPHWPNAGALARWVWTNVLPARVIPMVLRRQPTEIMANREDDVPVIINMC
eukprot:6362551-Pyramimonas_sp.AAC.1